MTQSKYDVFISYSRKDDEIVRNICNLFREENISYWMDKKEIAFGGEFLSDIAQAIRECKITLFISSSSSNNSIYTAKEVAMAFNEGKYIIPFKIDNSEFNKNLELVLCNLNWVEAIPFDKTKALELVSNIKSLLHGDKYEKEVKKENRQYININEWHQSQNKFIKKLTNFFNMAKIKIEPTLLENAVKGDKSAIKSMFFNFISPSDNIVDVQYFGSRGFFKFKTHSFVYVSAEKVGCLAIKPFGGEIVYQDAFIEDVNSGVIYQPSVIELYVISILLCCTIFGILLVPTWIKLYYQFNKSGIVWVVKEGVSVYAFANRSKIDLVNEFWRKTSSICSNRKDYFRK